MSETDGVVFDGEQGLRHCKECDSPELFAGEINQYGVCFGCADGDEDAGKPALPSTPDDVPSDPHSSYWLRSGRHG
jgi:hypothetical protein